VKVRIDTLTLEHVVHAEQTRVPLRAPAIGGSRSLITWADYIRARGYVQDRDAGRTTDPSFAAAAQRTVDALNEHASGELRRSQPTTNARRLG
jgi:hypothetical protein